jgi:4-amino-4-deoxy-L-arabinose transferase-like glycosyltransferase
LKTFFSFKYTSYLFIALIGIVLYVPFLGSVHLFDWDEINFAESAREMLVSGNYLDVQINYEVFWEKPPLFIWLQALSMHVFGINEFAARFPNALIGIATLMTLFSIGKKLINEKFGWIWMFAHALSVLTFLYFKSGIIDPLFNLFIFLGIYQFILFAQRDNNKWYRTGLSAFFIGLAILTKGPVALLLFLLTAFFYMIFRKKYVQFLNLKIILWYLFILSGVGGFWFILQFINGNASILQDFITYQIRLFQTKDAGHGGFLLYHFVVVLLGLFPISIWALGGMKTIQNETATTKDFHFWMKILLWVVLVLFTIVKTKIVHYSSMAYFPITFFGSYFLYYGLEQKKQFASWMKYSLVGIAFLFGLAMSALPLIGMNASKIIASGMIKDAFANANLQAEVQWTGLEILVGIIFFSSILVAMFKVKSKRNQIITIFSATLFFTYASMIWIVPNIEAYSQRAAIDFYQKASREKAYITTFGFKSYAHLFYSRKPLPKNPKHSDTHWLLNEITDQKVYVVAKNIKAQKFEKEHPNFIKLYEQNGFVFYEKTSPIQP